MKKQFESLKLGKFHSATLSPEAMRMVNGGSSVATRTDSGQGDTTYYQCCDGLYDKTTIFADRSFSTANSKTMWPNTTARDYES